jgi:hypothetical protein
MTIDLENRTAQTKHNQSLTWDRNTNVAFDLADEAGALKVRGDTISGSTGNDLVWLGAGDRALLGAGDDNVSISSGNCTARGQDGNDTISFDTDLTNLNIDVRSGKATFFDQNNRPSTVIFSGFEAFGFDNGTFIGSSKDEKISVYSGDSTITGNGGKDTFIFETLDEKKVDITDFARGDNIDLSNINFGLFYRRSDFRFIIDRNTFSVNFDNGHGYESSFKITAGNNYQFQQRDISLPDGWGWQT